MDMKFADIVRMYWTQYKTAFQAGYDVPILPDEFKKQLEVEKVRGPAIANAPWTDDATVDAQIASIAAAYESYYTKCILKLPLPNFALPEYVDWFNKAHAA